MSTYRYPFKCLSCGLHVNLYSWDKAWNLRYEAHCPECGKSPMFLLGVEKTDTEIFEHVSAVMHPMTELEERIEELKRLPT